MLSDLYGKKVRRRWWSLLNWLQGYRWGPIQRCRWCDHTSPSHYPTCRTQGYQW